MNYDPSFYLLAAFFGMFSCLFLYLSVYEFCRSRNYRIQTDAQLISEQPIERLEYLVGLRRADNRGLSNLQVNINKPEVNLLTKTK